MAPMYLYREYFKAKVIYYLGTWTLRVREDVADNALLGDRNFTRRPDVETDVAKLNQAFDATGYAPKECKVAAPPSRRLHHSQIQPLIL